MRGFEETVALSDTVNRKTMDDIQHVADVGIDWEATFERVAGTTEAPLSHHMLARHLGHTHGFNKDDAWVKVYEASEADELQMLVVEWFPGVYRKFYFIPRIRFEPTTTVFVPFWSYVYDGVFNGDGWFSRAELRDRIQQRADSSIPERILDSIDNYLEAITPVHEQGQSMRGTTIRTDISRLYKQLSDVAGPSTGHRPYESEMVSL